MQITFVFWNIHKRPEAFEHLVRLTNTHAANVVLVAEMPSPDTAGMNGDPAKILLEDINRSKPTARLPEMKHITKSPDSDSDSGADIVQIYSRLPIKTRWRREATHNRYTIWQVAIPKCRAFHLAAAHFASIQNDQGDGQRECAAALRSDLEQAERKLYADPKTYTNREPLSLVLGDLNANPFDPGIVGAYGLNATGLYATALEGSRNHQGREYPYLYNPMWRFLNADPPGSFYRKTDAPVRFDWFLLDQALVRPGLLGLFDKGKEPDLRLLTSDGTTELVTGVNKTPNKGISDHLPLLFRFQLPITRSAANAKNV